MRIKVAGRGLFRLFDRRQLHTRGVLRHCVAPLGTSRGLRATQAVKERLSFGIHSHVPVPRFQNGNFFPNVPVETRTREFHAKSDLPNRCATVRPPVAWTVPRLDSCTSVRQITRVVFTLESASLRRLVYRCRPTPRSVRMLGSQLLFMEPLDCGALESKRHAEVNKAWRR